MLFFSLSTLGSTNRTIIMASGTTFKNERVATREELQNGDSVLTVPNSSGQATIEEKQTPETFAIAVKARIAYLEAVDAESISRRERTSQAWNDVVAMLAQ